MRKLALLAALSACIYGVIAFLSRRFQYDSVTTERPIITVLILLAAAFLIYLLSLRLACRAPQTVRLLALIIAPAILFRLILLFSLPIQEIDIYRYLWDGAVSAAGVSPYRYTPDQVRLADPLIPGDPSLRRLVALRDGKPALREILGRAHFAYLPTIYPPTSQAVFWAAAMMTPDSSPILARILIMKAWFIGFDVATILLVVGLLKLCQKPIGLCLIYAWCPLLLKEVANSGHLDSLTVFLTTLAIYLLVKLLVKSADQEVHLISTSGCACVIAVILALAVGGKLYPTILAPLILAVLARRIGWPQGLLAAATFVVASLLILSPMLPRDLTHEPHVQNVELSDKADAPNSPVSQPITVSDPSNGVRTFLRRWEMNDLIFMVIVENLKPNSGISQRDVWFAIVPTAVRKDFANTVASLFSIDPQQVPFLAARALTAFAFLVLALLLTRRAAQSRDASGLCEAAFLTIAWFWLLCPTQNPWYWTWALPLLPFARGRAWLAVSGLVLLYYLRFWFAYHWPDTTVWGTPYVGAAFFDLIVIWVEFAPWLLWLAVQWHFCRRGILEVQEEAVARAPATATG